VSHPIRDRIKARNAEKRAELVAEVMSRGGCDEAAAEKAVRALEVQHPVLDWLAKLDWVGLLELALKLLPLFLAAEPKAASVAEQVFGTDV
jgi:hypothetical protein